MFSFDWARRQFPVRAAFAMTINKSQAQTLERAGICLDEPVFTHGQLASRVGDPANLRCLVHTQGHGFGPGVTRHVVYTELFL